MSLEESNNNLAAAIREHTAALLKVAGAAGSTAAEPSKPRAVEAGDGDAKAPGKRGPKPKGDNVDGDAKGKPAAGDDDKPETPTVEEVKAAVQKFLGSVEDPEDDGAAEVKKRKKHIAGLFDALSESLNVEIEASKDIPAKHRAKFIADIKGYHRKNAEIE